VPPLTFGCAIVLKLEIWNQNFDQFVSNMSSSRWQWRGLWAREGPRRRRWRKLWWPICLPWRWISLWRTSGTNIVEIANAWIFEMVCTTKENLYNSLLNWYRYDDVWKFCSNALQIALRAINYGGGIKNDLVSKKITGAKIVAKYKWVCIGFECLNHGAFLNVIMVKMWEMEMWKSR
jgi:hypothetical protein